MEKQKSGVEFIIESVKSRVLHTKEMLEEFEQAKEMEKQQQERLIDETLNAYGIINNLKTNKL